MLTILFEDAHCLAVSKPPGLLTQGRPAGEPTLEDRVRRYLDPEDPSGVYLGTVHRLDRPVTGVVLWAKTPKAARRLAEQFAGREARKEYWAVVEGSPTVGRGTWEDWLCPDETGLGVVQACRPGTPRARRALTRFEVGQARRLPVGNAWLVLWPETGRTHQLRAQAAARGLPIRGDRAYGAKQAFPEGIALHARSLTVRHPILQVALTFLAPLPGAWGGIELEEADSPQRHKGHKGYTKGVPGGKDSRRIRAPLRPKLLFPLCSLGVLCASVVNLLAPAQATGATSRRRLPIRRMPSSYRPIIGKARTSMVNGSPVGVMTAAATVITRMA